jgi:hypothetical protein
MGSLQNLFTYSERFLKTQLMPWEGKGDTLTNLFVNQTPLWGYEQYVQNEEERAKTKAIEEQTAYTAAKKVEDEKQATAAAQVAATEKASKDKAAAEMAVAAKAAADLAARRRGASPIATSTRGLLGQAPVQLKTLLGQ